MLRAPWWRSLPPRSAGRGQFPNKKIAAAAGQNRGPNPARRSAATPPYSLSGTWRLQESVLCTMSNCLAPTRQRMRCHEGRRPQIHNDRCWDSGPKR
jgi:hypothetical protein